MPLRWFTSAILFSLAGGVSNADVVDDASAIVKGLVHALLTEDIPNAASWTYHIATDTDDDGATTDREIAGNADPLNIFRDSRPDTDDDGDGIRNEDESNPIQARGVERPFFEARPTIESGSSGASVLVCVHASLTAQPRCGSTGTNASADNTATVLLDACVSLNANEYARIC